MKMTKKSITASPRHRFSVSLTPTLAEKCLSGCRHGSGSTHSSRLRSFWTLSCWLPRIMRFAWTRTISQSGHRFKSRLIWASQLSLSSNVPLKSSQWASFCTRSPTCARLGTSSIFSLSASVLLDSCQSKVVPTVWKPSVLSVFWGHCALWISCRRWNSRLARYWAPYPASCESSSLSSSSSPSTSSFPSLHICKNILKIAGMYKDELTNLMTKNSQNQKVINQAT